MKRHNFDPLSFTFGVLFAAASFSLWVGRFNFGAPSIRWAAAAFLLLLGGLLIATSRTGSRD
jgi:hypothetical protein